MNAPEELPCKDKLVFNTRKEAVAAATVAAHRYGGRFKPYICRHCGLWHLSTAYD